MAVKGDRIELTSVMADDPNPLPLGVRGTVTYASEVTGLGQPYEQIGVRWDNGRTLGLVSPPDRYRIIKEDT